jgi:hypothetical protein
MLWSNTPVKLYKAGVIDARATSNFRDVDKSVPSVTTTNSNPRSVAPAVPVKVKKSLQVVSIGSFLGTWRDSLN